MRGCWQVGIGTTKQSTNCKQHPDYLTMIYRTDFYIRYRYLEKWFKRKEWRSTTENKRVDNRIRALVMHLATTHPIHTIHKFLTYRYYFKYMLYKGMSLVHYHFQVPDVCECVCVCVLHAFVCSLSNFCIHGHTYCLSLAIAHNLRPAFLYTLLFFLCHQSKHYVCMYGYEKENMFVCVCLWTRGYLSRFKFQFI